MFSCLGVHYISLGKNYIWMENKVIGRIIEETDKFVCYDLIIKPQVINFEYDDRYIVAYQIYDAEDTYYEPPADLEVRDSLLQQYEKIRQIRHCYWIIDKKNDKIMGPMTKSDFDISCKKLKVKARMPQKNMCVFFPATGDTVQYNFLDSMLNKTDTIN